MPKLVSVVIPCFNQGCFLAEAIASLQRQTYADWEAIIVDDGSRDETPDVAAGLCRQDRRVRTATKANGGLSSARNVGINLCRGEYVQFLDADDLLNPLKFEVQATFLSNCLDIDVVYGNAKYFVDGDFGNFTRGPYARDSRHDWITERWEDAAPLLDKMVVSNLFPVCSPLLRRSVLDKIGLFNERLTALEDWEYWLRAAAAGLGFRYLMNVGSEALIRIHPASMTRDAERMRSAVYRLRASCHEWLPPGTARAANLARLLPTITLLKGQERAAGYIHLARFANTSRERAFVSASNLCAVGGPLNWVARRALGFLPEHHRRQLSVQGLRFE
jgi:glycosyltransferase involved in cell wall biosynthesis